MKITVKFRGELREIDALECGVPGLAIHPSFSGITYCLTHVRSGLSLFCFDDPEAALAGAQALGALLPDWTVSAEDVADEISTWDAYEAVGRWGGRTPAAQTGDYSDVAAVTS